MAPRSITAVIAGLVIAAPAVAQTADPCVGVRLGPRSRCGTIAVAEDRAATSGGGRRITIRYVVVGALRPAGREPVFLFAGGPGAGSTGDADLAFGPFAPVNETRDIVMVDQRGTGGSNMLSCPVDLVTQPALAFGHVFDPALFIACRPGLERRADLRLYTTERAIEDVDQVRAELGYERVLLWGGSYGTRIAQAYARRYPTRVAAAVLDGVVPFDFRAPAGYARSLQRSFERVVADCQAAPTCDSANPDLIGALGRMVTRLRSGPASVTVRRRDSSTAAVNLALGDFGYAVRGILYQSRGARRLPALLTAANRTGDLSPFAQAYWERAANFNDEFADGLHFAIFCAEDVKFIRPGEVSELARGAFLGTYLLDEYLTVCRDWPLAPLDSGAREPLRIKAPVLLVSGWFDPVTPPETGERVAAGLPNARHLVVRNEAHGAGFRCALPAVLHVLTKATLEGLPAVCAGVTNLFTSGTSGSNQSPAAAQSTPDHALAHPIFGQYYSCAEHAAGELKYQGDDLGTDCVIAKLVEIDGRTWARPYQGTGARNEDWYGWGQDVLAPCTCEVVKVSLNAEVNLPGILGKPPASIIVFRRDDDVHFILAHVADVTVTAGQKVQAGEKVAVVGNNGMSRSPHIHVGAWKGSQALQIRFDLTALGAIRKQQ